MSIDDMIAVLQAAKAGKRIQRRFTLGTNDPWHNFDAFSPICWNTYHYDYRVKPEPREWWLIDSHSRWDAHAFQTRESADNFNQGYKGQPPIKVREVIE